MPSFFKKVFRLLTGTIGGGANAAGEAQRADRPGKQGEPAEERLAGSSKTGPSAVGMEDALAEKNRAPSSDQDVSRAEGNSLQSSDKDTPGAETASRARKGPNQAGQEAARSQANAHPPACEPERLSGPRNGTPDDLTRIKGIGPAIERLLFEHGIYHFDQIAGWREGESQWIDRMVGFAGRVGRERWVEQAREFTGREDQRA